MKKIGVCVFEETKLESSVWLLRHGEQPETAGAGEGEMRKVGLRRGQQPVPQETSPLFPTGFCSRSTMSTDTEFKPDLHMGASSHCFFFPPHTLVCCALSFLPCSSLRAFSGQPNRLNEPPSSCSDPVNHDSCSTNVC